MQRKSAILTVEIVDEELKLKDFVELLFEVMEVYQIDEHKLKTIIINEAVQYKEDLELFMYNSSENLNGKHLQFRVSLWKKRPVIQQIHSTFYFILYLLCYSRRKELHREING